jgi:hypothetical protein
MQVGQRLTHEQRIAFAQGVDEISQRPGLRPGRVENGNRFMTMLGFKGSDGFPSGASRPRRAFFMSLRGWLRIHFIMAVGPGKNRCGWSL